MIFNKIFYLLFIMLCLATTYLECSVFVGNHDYETMTYILKRYAHNYPKKTYLYSIGKSLLNKEIWVLAIADSNPDRHVYLRPEVKLIGNTHGILNRYFNFNYIKHSH